MTDSPVIPANARIKITKGCRARNIQKGDSAQVREVIEGDRRSFTVRLFFLNGWLSGKTVSFQAQHVNRLREHEVFVHDGNPTHKIGFKWV